MRAWNKQFPYKGFSSSTHNISSTQDFDLANVVCNVTCQNDTESLAATARNNNPKLIHEKVISNSAVTKIQMPEWVIFHKTK